MILEFTIHCKHKLINTNQLGFRFEHLAEHVLISLTETIKKYLLMVKTFDAVNHEILLKKLNYYGIRSKQNDYFRSFLGTRNNMGR